MAEHLITEEVKKPLLSKEEPCVQLHADAESENCFSNGNKEESELPISELQEPVLVSPEVTETDLVTVPASQLPGEREESYMKPLIAQGSESSNDSMCEDFRPDLCELELAIDEREDLYEESDIHDADSIKSNPQCFDGLNPRSSVLFSPVEQDSMLNANEGRTKIYDTSGTSGFPGVTPKGSKPEAGNFEDGDSVEVIPDKPILEVKAYERVNVPLKPSEQNLPRTMNHPLGLSAYEETEPYDEDHELNAFPIAVLHEKKIENSFTMQYVTALSAFRPADRETVTENYQDKAQPTHEMKHMVIEPVIHPVTVEKSLAGVDLFPSEEKTNVKKTFQLRECKSLRIKKPGHNFVPRCGCGRLVADHPEGLVETIEDGEWMAEQDTRKESSYPRNLYFQLKETSGNRSKSARYVRLVEDTDMEFLAKYHKESWLPNYKPDVIISFLGGCGNEFMSRHSEKTLIDGLSKIIHTHDSLFFTRASHTGLAKLIGSICNSYTRRWNSGYVTQCAGFMPWGCVAGRETLQYDKGDEVVDYRLSNQDDIKFSLNHNHADFYLVDDGRVGNFGCESSLRSGLQQFLSFEQNIPSINLLHGGGVTSISELHSSIFPNKEAANRVLIPLVVLKNSGRAADVISFVIETDLNNDKWIHRKYMKYRSISLMLAAKSAAIKYMNIDLSDMTSLRSLAKIRECVEIQRERIFICDVEKQSSGLYELILEAGLQVSFFDKETNLYKPLPTFRELKIAIELKRVKHGRELIREKRKAAYYPMDDSLLRCNPRIIQELLEKYDFDIESYVADTLQYLYTSEEYRDTQGVRHVIDFFKKKYPYKAVAKEEAFITIDINKTLDKLTEESLSDVHELSDGKIVHRKECVNSTQALLICNIVINQPSIVKVFWKFDKYNALSNALLAFQLQSSIAKLYDSSPPDQLKESIEYYKEKMIQLLSVYHETDHAMTEKVLTRKIPMWRDRSLIEVAGDFKAKFFIEQPATQIVVKKAWNGEDPDRKAYMGELKDRSESRDACCLPTYFFGLCHFIHRTMGTPWRKLLAHMVMYLLTVLMFSFFMVFADSPAHQPIKWIMFVIICSLALEEVRQVTDFGKKKLFSNFKLWIKDPWNQLDVICILLFYAGFTTSFYHKLAANWIYSVFLFLWCMKVTQFLRMSKTIGPYMVMIFQMLDHMKTFLVVLFISIFGYGVFMAALLFPNTLPTWNIFFTVLFRPYLLVFGDTGVENRQLRNSETVFGTNKISRVSEILVIIGMALFMLFANVLLLNLLIAAFSNIYDRVKAESYQIWRFEQFELLKEFEKRPMLPFPFSIPENLSLITRYFRGAKKQTPSDKRQRQKADREISDFEKFCMMKLWPKLSLEDQEELDGGQSDVATSMGELIVGANCSLLRNWRQFLASFTVDSTIGDDCHLKTFAKHKEELRKRVEATKASVLDRLEKTEEKMEQRLDSIEAMILKLSSLVENREGSVTSQ